MPGSPASQHKAMRIHALAGEGLEGRKEDTARSTSSSARLLRGRRGAKKKATNAMLHRMRAEGYGWYGKYNFTINGESNRYQAIKNPGPPRRILYHITQHSSSVYTYHQWQRSGKRKS
ncbi:hypothetical protein TWF696_007570 [Orbilia brochopaga]|uniref:Uncharacterized protein n=1 Tax=Orbilia brochopaga TaxID=3140254 RepID=A0AAV9UKI8_9PEZI